MGTSKVLMISPEAMNKHMLLVGMSGGGKTESAKYIVNQIVTEGGKALAIDYSGSFACDSEEEDIKRINVFEEGFPLPFLSPIRRPDDTVEDIGDIQEEIVDVFCNVSRLGVRQKAAMRRAVETASRLIVINPDLDEICAIGRALEMDDDDEVAASVYDRFYNLLTKVRVSKGIRLLESGKLTVLDLSGFSPHTQRILAELILAVIWRYFRVWGQRAEEDLFILCDEFQILNSREDGILDQILREGRKYHIALVLATQTLESFNKRERAVIQQVGTQMFFRPAGSEVDNVLKWIGVGRSSELKKSLMTLDRGECIAVGRFDLGKRYIEYPIKITFRTDTR